MKFQAGRNAVLINKSFYTVTNQTCPRYIGCICSVISINMELQDKFADTI